MDSENSELSDRREFLRSLGKWSAAAIAAILFIEETVSSTSAQWVNRRGSWVNGSGGGGWLNRGGSWANGGSAWVNRGGGGGWINHRGGGGGSWINR